MNYTTPYLIALADDDQDDREIFTDVCAEMDISIKVRSFENGLKLLEYLNLPDVEMPYILFLDINMPIKDGFETLNEIRNKIELMELCVIIYSTSTTSFDVKKAKKLGANGFLQKPASYAKLKAAIQKILDTDWSDPCSHLDEMEFVIAV